MCKEDSYHGQTSYPADKLGYTAVYANDIQQFIHEQAEKYLNNQDGFKNSLGGQSGTKDLANALVNLAFAATAPKYEWSFTVNFYYDYVRINTPLGIGLLGVPIFQCWPKPEEVGYVHSLDEFGFNKMWIYGSLDDIAMMPLESGGTPGYYFDVKTVARQHWCFDDDGVNLSLSLSGVCAPINDATGLRWYILDDSEATPLHVSVTVQLADHSWVHHRDMAIQTVSTPNGDRRGIEIASLGQKFLACVVHAVVKASVSS